MVKTSKLASRVAWDATPYDQLDRMIAFDPARIVKLIRLLEVQHQSADLGNLPNPIDELVWIPLTRQTHRQNAVRCWQRIQERGGPQALLGMPEEGLAVLLKDGGFSRQKARWIKGALAQVMARFGRLSLGDAAGWSDQEVEAFLVTLPGISIKSAKCVMMYSLGRLVLPVDTHLRRLAERLGWTPRGLSERRIHETLEAMVPPEARVTLHVNAIWHGRGVCKAIRPRCDECVIQWACRYGVKKA